MESTLTAKITSALLVALSHLKRSICYKMHIIKSKILFFISSLLITNSAAVPTLAASGPKSTTAQGTSGPGHIDTVYVGVSLSLSLFGAARLTTSQALRRQYPSLFIPLRLRVRHLHLFSRFSSTSISITPPLSLLRHLQLCK
jgi:hypothetical protein